MCRTPFEQCIGTICFRIVIMSSTIWKDASYPSDLRLTLNHKPWTTTHVGTFQERTHPTSHASRIPPRPLPSTPTHTHKPNTLVQTNDNRVHPRPHIVRLRPIRGGVCLNIGICWSSRTARHDGPVDRKLDGYACKVCLP